MDHIGDGFSMMAGSAGEPHVTTSAELLDFGGGAEEIYMGQVSRMMDSDLKSLMSDRAQFCGFLCR